MEKIILYHGTFNKVVEPQYGLGEKKHDYGKGFYLTENIELAKEWAVCRPDKADGWVHKYELDITNLKVLDFQQYDILFWLAELMRHRDASHSKRYRVLSKKFTEKYKLDVGEYDVIKGWRADASYFYIAKEFVRDNIDVEILEKLLLLGNLGIQYCIKSKLAYSKLVELKNDLVYVDRNEYSVKYDKRDVEARENMYELINSDVNKVRNVFSKLIEE